MNEEFKRRCERATPANVCCVGSADFRLGPRPKSPYPGKTGIERSGTSSRTAGYQSLPGGPIFSKFTAVFSTDHVGAVVSDADAQPGRIGPPRAKWRNPRSNCARTTLRRWRGPRSPPPVTQIRRFFRKFGVKLYFKRPNAAPGQSQDDGVQRRPGRRLIGRKHERSRDARHGTQGQGVHEVEAAPNDQTCSRRLRHSNQAQRTCFSSRGVHGNRLRHHHLGVPRPERARATSVLPSRDQNIIIVHTPDIEAADRLIGDFAVNTEKGSVPLHGYLRQDGGNTCHGVIVVRNTDTTETLQHRVCWRAGTIVEIRKFGTSNKARITFAGKEKPRYVHYDNMVVSVQNYYKTIPACGQCGAVGHRGDACPNLQPNTCGLCGLHAPLVEGVLAPHNCVPRCSVCGGAHATNSRDCAAKFRTPKTAAKKSGKQK
ncbi:hypothetical protein HPB49_026375 [Dermacentor silvarum]|nr:hypothetical protein HPB49_026375 [Dermacentor silvarum]